VDAGAKTADGGLTAIPVRFAPVTFNWAVPVTAPNVAPMATDPVATVVAIPLVPVVVLIVATVGSLDAQLASPEMT